MSRVASLGRFVRSQRLERRELVTAQLVEPLGGEQVLQPVVAEVAQLVPRSASIARSPVTEAPARRARPGDPRRHVQVDADVLPVGEFRLARVDSHAHANGPDRERALCRRRPR